MADQGCGAQVKPVSNPLHVCREDLDPVSRLRAPAPTSPAMVGHDEAEALLESIDDRVPEGADTPETGYQHDGDAASDVAHEEARTVLGLDPDLSFSHSGPPNVAFAHDLSALPHRMLHCATGMHQSSVFEHDDNDSNTF